MKPIGTATVKIGKRRPLGSRIAETVGWVVAALAIVTLFTLAMAGLRSLFGDAVVNAAVGLGAIAYIAYIAWRYVNRGA